MGLLDQLLERIRGASTWPPPQLRDQWAAMELWAAFRTSDVHRLKMEASIPWWRKYLISPVPRMISRASANLLYGEPCEHRPPNEADVAALDKIVDENGLPAEEHRMAMICSSESAVWGRIAVDPTLADVPIIQFESPRNVIGHFRGRFVVGATFVTTWEESLSRVYRLLETYEPGAVRCELYLGTRTRLGTNMALESFGPTQGKLPMVPTGFDRPLVAFIPNSIDADPTRGFGDYQGLEERFLAINETVTIGHENAKLAGKKRALLDARYLRNGKLPAGDDIFVRTEENVTAGDAGKPLQLLEYGFEAGELVKWLDTTIDTTLNLAGTAPELVGRNRETGNAISGTALKLKMMHSLMEASGKGGYADRGIRWLLRAAAIIDSRPTTQGGFGRRWVEPDADPTIVRGDGLPHDDMEAAQWVVLATGAEAISVEERVRWLHPDWDDDQVQEEVRKLEEAKQPSGDPRLNEPQIPTPRPPVVPQLGAGEPAPAQAGGQ